MHQIFQTLSQVAQWCVANPRNMQITLNLFRAAQQGYQRLSPAAKAKVDSIMIRAAHYLVNAAVGDVLSWARAEAVMLGLDSDAATVVEVGVRKVAEVGLPKAFEAMGRRGASEAELEAARDRIAQEAARSRAQQELERLRREQEAREVQERLEREERERQVRLVIERENDRPWRIMRNTGRVAKAVGLAILTIACFASAEGFMGFCFVKPLGFMLGFGTLYALATCGQKWES